MDFTMVSWITTFDEAILRDLISSRLDCLTPRSLTLHFWTPPNLVNYSLPVKRIIAFRKVPP